MLPTSDVTMLATGPGPVQLHPALKVEPDATIAAFDAAHLIDHHQMSERRACRAIGFCRMTIRYDTRRIDDHMGGCETSS